MPGNLVDVGGACQTLSTSIYADYHINNSLATYDSASVQCQCKNDDNELMEIQEDICQIEVMMNLRFRSSLQTIRSLPIP